ncbi:DUF2937 family protein [Methylomarinum sp. Ch1-1]|uniref:DUF2937 family protein n=1 Tax=Methylomarinum roseum TaxID=3067653 RepID=A0AAU7NTY0_9GAMM|nr:DUF2937 family protein [Methylomarinum sp. Ch1-1]MDP4519507.1 DUF2937 family protein [Methylomarinum sp. Ch1-1]
MLLSQSLKSLLDKLFFAGILLLGMQLPNFVMQYQQNLAARYDESQKQIRPYQQLANRFYAGDIGQLLTAHRHNGVAAIRAEAGILAASIERNDYLHRQLNALQNKPLHRQILRLATDLDFEIAEQVMANYAATIPLNAEALSAGLTLALAFNIAVHLLISALRRIVRIMLTA